MEKKSEHKKRGIIIELSGKSLSGKTTFSNTVLLPIFEMMDKDIYYFGESRDRAATLKIIKKVRYKYDFIIFETTEEES